MNTSLYESTKIKVERILNTLSRKQWYTFYIGILLFVLSFIVGILVFNESLKVPVSKRGGIYTEGIIGIPRFINPLLAISDADKDLTHLVYAGLVRRDADGTLVPYLAESYAVSPDGKTYTFKLRDNLVFHDGTRITADDVVYTINALQNPQIKSPEKIKWEGITVKKENDFVVSFTLKQRYVSFLDNAQIGILPKKLWDSLTPEQFALTELNIKPVGAGPYVVDSIEKNKSGIPTSYTLHAFKKYLYKEPYITNFKISFFGNEKEMIDGLKNNIVDAISQTSPLLTKDLENTGKYTLSTYTLPRIFGLFINQSRSSILRNSNIREIVNTSIDRKALVETVLYGYGETKTNALPSWLFKQNVEDKNKQKSLEEITRDIEDLGYTKDESGIFIKKGKKGQERLNLTLTTLDAPELRQVAEFIKTELSKIGIEVNLQVFEQGTLNQKIRERDYDVLLFGQNIEQEAELFAFWHSSQRSDPGLNITGYTNARIDKLLESIHKEDKKEERKKIYQKIDDIINEDSPAIFLYSPLYTYIQNKNTAQIKEHSYFILPEDRFTAVHTWYIHTEKVWKWFAPKTQK